MTSNTRVSGQSTIGYIADRGFAVKYARQNSIHVSPTALWDGLIANEVSSSWVRAEWSEFLKAKVTA